MFCDRSHVLALLYITVTIIHTADATTPTTTNVGATLITAATKLRNDARPEFQFHMRPQSHRVEHGQTFNMSCNVAGTETHIKSIRIKHGSLILASLDVDIQGKKYCRMFNYRYMDYDCPDFLFQKFTGNYTRHPESVQSRYGITL